MSQPSKTETWIWNSIYIILMVGSFILFKMQDDSFVHAQPAAPQGIQLTAVASLAQCFQPSANNGLWLVCPVIGSGVYSSINGSAYTLLGGAPPFPASCPAGTVGPAGITFGANCK